MVDVKCINLSFTIKVTENNITIVKKLFNQSNMVQVDDEDEIEIGEDIDLNFCFEGELQDEVISMAMLFNSSLSSKPLIKLSRN